MKILNFIWEILIMPFALSCIALLSWPILMILWLLTHVWYDVWLSSNDLMLSNFLWITSIIGFTILLTCEYINKLYNN